MPAATRIPTQTKPISQIVFDIGASTISGAAGGAVIGGEIFGLYGGIGGAFIGGTVNALISGVSATKGDSGAESGR
jgi:hypothetical protein